MTARKTAWLLLLEACAIVTSACHAADRTYTAGDSMVPTIAVGKRVGVRVREREAVRGRVIVFRAPERPDREYVKRIVGIPGDTVSSTGTEIRLNGVPIPQCRVGPFRYAEEDGGWRAGELWLEALDGASFLVFHSTPTIPIPAGQWTVAPGEVFVLGDSRENSHDSRFWFGGSGGGLPLRFIVGTVIEADGSVLPKEAASLGPALAACKAKLSR